MTGWICPKCGSVYAPFVAGCRVCNSPTFVGTTTDTGPRNVCPGCGQDRSMPPLTGCPSGSHYGTACGGRSSHETV